MANYTAYIPAVGSVTYPIQISNFIRISEAIDTEVENARNGETTLLDSINLKLSLTGGAMSGTITNFTSTGIDDNATANAITIDTSQNVSFTGTVDGRDIATDGTKLDGIESSADITDTANVTSAGALMDSEIDIDLKTLSLPANTTISTFGASLVDDIDAEEARTTLETADIAGDTFTGQLNSTAGDLNLKTTTALSDADATLTGAQLKSGEFTITPTVARTLTTDTAVNIIAAITESVDNSNFEFTVVNNAAFDVTIAAGAGVTLVGGVILNKGSATFRVKRLTSATVSITRLDEKANLGYMYVRDEKAQGTDGGTSIAGVQTRTLNTVVTNTITGASLATNQVTLPAGTYDISCRSPTRRSSQTVCYLWNVTDSILALGGTPSYSLSTESQTIRSQANGRLTITAEKTFKLEHYTAVALATDGLGNQATHTLNGIEIYAEIEINKVV